MLSWLFFRYILYRRRGFSTCPLRRPHTHLRLSGSDRSRIYRQVWNRLKGPSLRLCGDRGILCSFLGCWWSIGRLLGHIFLWCTWLDRMGFEGKYQDKRCCLPCLWSSQWYCRFHHHIHSSPPFLETPLVKKKHAHYAYHSDACGGHNYHSIVTSVDLVCCFIRYLSRHLRRPINYLGYFCIYHYPSVQIRTSAIHAGHSSKHRKCCRTEILALARSWTLLAPFLKAVLSKKPQ